MHYVDLAGLQARSLRDFGAPPPLGPLSNRAQPPRAVRQLGLSVQGLASPRLRQDVACTPQVFSWLHRPACGRGTGSSLLPPQPHIMAVDLQDSKCVPSRACYVAPAGIS